MINLDRAAAAAPYPRFDADLNTAIRMWRHYAGDHAAEQAIDAANQEITATFGFKSDQIHWFGSASQAISWLSETIDKMLYCTAAEHRCSRRAADWVVPINGFKIDTLKIQKTAIFVVSLKNNELGFAPDEEAIQFLLGRPPEMWLVVDATGGDPNHPLIASADAVFASPCKWGAIPGSGFLLLRHPVDGQMADRWTGFGKGTPSLAAIFTTAGALKWIASPVGIAAQSRSKTKADIIKSVASELNWILNGEGQDILNYNIGMPSDIFLAALLDAGVRAARGAACQAGEPSEVISALFSKETAEQTVRFSWDRMTKVEDIHEAAKIVKQVYCECKKIYRESEEEKRIK